MDTFIKAHLERVAALINPSAANMSYAGWIEGNTRLRGEPFSFLGHEYQQYILELEAPILYVKKPSQIGISELITRFVLAFLNRFQGVNAIYVLPSAKFSQTFSQTRFDPVISGSELLSRSVDPDVDSVSVKRFLNGSQLFFQGAAKTNQAISIPCDLLVADEYDFMENPAIISSFTSRMTHSDHDLRRFFSTPTHENRGVSAGFADSVRHVVLQKCQRCGHWWKPDYYSDVVLPGFDGDLEEFCYNSRHLLSKYDVSAAYLQCPRCHRDVDQFINENRQFVVENPSSKSHTVGVALTPWCAPKHMPVPKMIRTSTDYRLKSDFVNYCLGEAHSDASSGFTEQELELLFTHDVRYPEYPPFVVFGMDVGGECAYFDAFLAPDGHIRITNAELIPLHKAKERLPEIAMERRALSGVVDALPQLWAALKESSKAKGTNLHSIRAVEENERKATFGLRQVNFKRDKLLDHVMERVRSGGVSFGPGTFPLKDVIISHLTDMRRVKRVNADGDEIYVWDKSDSGVDHFHHALAFLVLADFVKDVPVDIPLSLPFLATKFRANPGM